MAKASVRKSGQQREMKTLAVDGSGASEARRKWSRINTREVIQQGQANRANGSAKPGLSRADSLNVPGARAKDTIEDGRGSPHSQTSDKSGSDSRRGSSRSIDSRMSAIDLSKIQGAPLAADDELDEKPKANVSDTAMRSAIPYMPMWLAVLCFILNVFIPGVGTMLSGFSIFCGGKTRFGSKDNNASDIICTNIFVGFSQLFTVTFMLVGWFWSLVWGIYMVILAVEHMKQAKVSHEKELQALALTAFSPQVRPWTLR